MWLLVNDLSRTSPASALLLAYLDDQLQALTKQSRGVRRDEPDSVHKMRISIRRLRAVLRTYRQLLEPDVSAHLRSELQWLASTSGQARDAQVLHERLTHLLDDQPADLVVGPVRQRIDEELQGDFEAGRAALTFALESDRFVRLVDALDDVLADPPLTPQAAKPANKTLPRLLDKTGRRLHRAVEAATGTEGPERDTALHEVRKCAKQLRYAAEVAIPIRPKRAVRLSETAHDLQRILGAHHDSAVARDLLLRLAAEAHRRGESDLTYGRLHALEEDAAAELDARFARAWVDLPKIAL